MSRPSGPVLPAAAVFALAGAVGAVPGCRLHREQRWRGVAGVAAGNVFGLTVTGRSPTLHEADMHWDVEVDLSLDDAGLAASVLDQAARRIAVQRTRAEDGLTLGHALPLPMNRGYSGMASIDIDHVSMDASALALRLSALPSGSVRHDVVRSLEAPLRTVHLAGRKGDGGRVHRHDGTLVTDAGGPRRIEVTTAIPAGDGTTDAVGFLVGQRLHLDDVSLPDTALAAMAGRRLDALARLHPLLDARIVASAANTRTRKGQHRIAVTLRPLLVPLGDVTGLARRGETARDIVERLRLVIGEASPNAADAPAGRG